MKLNKSQVSNIERGARIADQIKRRQAIQELVELDFDDRRSKYSNVPSYAINRRKFSDDSANGLTECIVTYLRLRHHMAWRQTSEGRYRPGKSVTDVLGHVRQMKGSYLPGLNNGAADVGSVINGTFYCWEIKMKDAQSEKQKQYQREVEEAGGFYYIVRSFHEFLNIYKDI